jgi:hypothetical protein
MSVETTEDVGGEKRSGDGEEIEAGTFKRGRLLNEEDVSTVSGLGGVTTGSSCVANIFWSYTPTDDKNKKSECVGEYST